MYLILLFLSFAEARVFNFKNEHFAPYFRGSIGLSQLDQSAYDGTSGASTLFNEEPEYIYSGEVGFLFSSTYLGLSVGLEFLTSQKLESEGINSGGTSLMDLESEVKATILKMGIIWYYKTFNSHRGYIAFNAGYANLNMSNAYELTATGTATYPGVDDFVEKATAVSIMGEILFGYELHLADASTVIFEGGYRYFDVSKWEYDNSGTNFLGAYSKGSTVLNADGSKKRSDLGGIVFGLGFRFYID